MSEPKALQRANLWLTVAVGIVGLISGAASFGAGIYAAGRSTGQDAAGMAAQIALVQAHNAQQDEQIRELKQLMQRAAEANLSLAKEVGQLVGALQQGPRR